MEKTISSDMTSEYEPDLPWNRLIQNPKNPEANQAGSERERPIAERLRVVISWPTIEESSRLSESGSTSAISLAYAKHCIADIINPQVAGISARNGKELMAVKAKGKRKAWQLAVNVGAYIFTQSFLSEDEEKN